jgi:predicted nucleic acid-binding protein
MTVVISDTSPVNYLVLIGEIDLLPALYRKILIPDAVLSELRDPGSPPAVAAWASVLPEWAEVVLMSVEAVDSSPPGGGLDAGELAAIALAGSLGGDVLLVMDDADGRAEAVRRGFRITGTLGVLRAAAKSGMVDIGAAIDRLRRTNFYLPPKLVAFLLTEERGKKGGVS